jgi:threonine dehydratase
LAISLKNGKPFKLDEITSRAQSICVQSPTKKTFKYIKENISGIAVVSDHDARIAQKEIYEDMGEFVELASSCCIAALKNSCIPNIINKKIVVLACGENSSKAELDNTIDNEFIGESFIENEVL